MGTRYKFMSDNSPVYNEGNRGIIISSEQYSDQGQGPVQGKNKDIIINGFEN